MKQSLIILLFISISLFAQNSRENDSLALIVIREIAYKDQIEVYGERDVPISQWSEGRTIDAWEGVVLDRNGRVIELDLTDAQISSLPAEIGNLSELQELSLLNNRLRSLPKELFTLQKINHLYLSENLFDTIPAGIAELKELKTLRIEANRFVPQELSSLSNLEYLRIEGGDTIDAVVSMEFSGLKNLRKLRLIGVDLTNQPLQFQRHPKLKELIIGYATIDEVPNSLQKLTALQELAIYDCQLTTLPEWFYSLSIDSLNISNNIIDSRLLTPEQNEWITSKHVEIHNGVPWDKFQRVARVSPLEKIRDFYLLPTVDFLKNSPMAIIVTGFVYPFLPFLDWYITLLIPSSILSIVILALFFRKRGVRMVHAVIPILNIFTFCKAVNVSRWLAAAATLFTITGIYLQLSPNPVLWHINATLMLITWIFISEAVRKALNYQKWMRVPLIIFPIETLLIISLLPDTKGKID